MSNKGFSPILILLLGLFLISGIGIGYYFANSKKPILENIPEKGDLTTSPYIETPFTNTFKRNFKAGDEFFIKQVYPEELLKVNEVNLAQLTCTSLYGYDYNSPNTFMDNQNQKLTDRSLISLVEKAKGTLQNEQISTFQACKFANGYTLLIYEIQAGGGGMDNKIYFGVESPDGKFLKKANLPNDGDPYFTCYKPLQLNLVDNLWYECGGGDGGYGSASIYRIDLNDGGYKRIIKCTSIANSEATGSAITCK